MIAAVKGWSAVLSALLFFIPAAARAADDLATAARDLARKTAAFTGRNESVTVVWRNVSSLGSTELYEMRAAFESALAQSGVRSAEAAAAEARLTLSENRGQYLLVEELRKGDDRQVWIGSWKRSEAAAAAIPRATIEKKLIWEQEEPMLDVAFPAGAMLVLAPSGVTLFSDANGHWERKSAASLNSPKAWPRDPRGRLRLHGGAFDAYLPGAICSGAVEPELAVTCRASDEPWVLESGSRALLLGNFMAARNYFDGRVATQTGQRKAVPPFYSAAAVEDQGRPLWVLALMDGRTLIFDGAFEPAGSVSGWGSDIAGVDAPCAGGAAILATRPTDGTMPDGVQAFSLVNRNAVAVAQGRELPGPVTALWPAGGATAVAIVHNLATGRYEAYLFTVACG